jgi:WD40 repeat protein
VEPIINDYWTRARFPFQILDGFRQLEIAGLPYEGYGCPAPPPPASAYALDAETLEPDGEPVELDQQVVNVYAGPDNHTAIVLTTDRFSVVDLDNGRVDHQGEAPGAFSGEFSPDGHTFAVGGQGDVRLLDVDTGEWAGPPREGHTGTIYTVDYSPDGATFATNADDRAIVLWDAPSGAPVNKVLPGRPTDGGNSPGFLPGGHTILIASSEGAAIYTLDTRPEHWIQAACAIAGRNLTPDEWTDAFGQRPYRTTCPQSNAE